MKQRFCLALAVAALLGFGCSSPSSKQPAESAAPPDEARQGMESVAASLFELPPGRWEQMSGPQRHQHLEDLIAKYERIPPWDRSRRGKFPALYYAMATLLSQQGESEEGLGYLDKAEPDAGSQGIHYMIRGRILEGMGRGKEAFRHQLIAFSFDLRSDIWSDVRRLATQNDVPIEQAVAQIQQIQQERSLPFPDFRFRTPTGELRTLDDYSAKALLVNFFFPG